MSDILLSSEKQSRFEKMMERAIQEEFGEDVNVKVRGNGKVLVLSEESRGKADVMKQDYDVFEVLSELDFEFGKSSYELRRGNRNLIGASFYIRRDGW